MRAVYLNFKLAFEVSKPAFGHCHSTAACFKQNHRHSANAECKLRKPHLLPDHLNLPAYPFVELRFLFLPHQTRV